jgi:beta-lactamase class D
MTVRLAAWPCLVVALHSIARGQTGPVPEGVISNAFTGRDGSLVIIECASGAVSTFRPQTAAARFAPCSTFKIWNALFGLELGLISAAEQPFYQWDGQERPVASWNRDLTLGEAFQASCVPAFQDLARRIGPERMRDGLAKVEYGDQDISAGTDVFWLPAKGRKTILISPIEQARLMHKLAAGETPFSKRSLTVLKDLMTVERTDNGTLLGKTGSGANADGKYGLGWFVGYAESRRGAYAFACLVQGDGLTGKDARAIVENVLRQQGILRRQPFTPGPRRREDRAREGQPGSLP